MPLVPALPPTKVPVFSGFDYVAVDAAHRRVLAAHTASEALLVVDADTGKVVAQIRTGPMHGVAFDPASGHVFTGNGTDQSVSEIDLDSGKVLRSADVTGNVDAIAYDASNGRIYADEDDGTHVYVVDAKTMKTIKTIDVPGHKPEYLAVDPATHEVYQNISDISEVAVIDPQTMSVKRTFKTPEIEHNHPLQFDAAYGHVLVGGTNGTIASYDKTGKLLGTVAIQPRVDQCTLDETSHRMACAGSGKLTLIEDQASGAPTLLAQVAVPNGAHTVAIDSKTGNVWIVYSSPDGDFAQSFAFNP